RHRVVPTGAGVLPRPHRRGGPADLSDRRHVAARRTSQETGDTRGSSPERGAMRLMSASLRRLGRLGAVAALMMTLAAAFPHSVVLAQPAAEGAAAQPERVPGGEANLKLPDLGLVDVGGYDGRTLLLIGIGVSVAGLLFGLVILNQLKNLPVHSSMREISELIYETCKTYLVTQGRFLAILEIFIAVIIVLYFGVLEGYSFGRVGIILVFSIVGILGSYSVAWF